uniref:HDC12614 n=1 Tax=Drosophila melanogaster TaxID=7227 RepID=Q6IKE9_DROME|nr:TPA_inf: HDC12614 [Drosophila melanogaster]
MNQIECDYDDEAVMTRLLPMSHRRMMEMDGGRSAPGMPIKISVSSAWGASTIFVD